METSGLQTWQDVLAMVGVERESSALDFKAEITRRGGELAKDIAAMAVDGGVLVYGLREDKATGLAARVTPVDLAGAEERIRQVIASSIEPVPLVEILEIRGSETDTSGVIVITVPKSSRGPHMVNGRYVLRHGTTTRWMTEREVALAYNRRGQAARKASPAELLSDVARLPGLTDVRAQSALDGFGQLRVVVRPVDEHVEHPDGVLIKAALENAVREASARVFGRLAVHNTTTLLASISDWRPTGTEGWIAGCAGGDEASLAARPSAAGVVIYPSRVTLQVTIPTGVEDDHGLPSYQCAHEGKVAAELFAALCFSSAYFAALPSCDLSVGVQLAGFGGAVSYHASHAHPAIQTGHLPGAAHGDLLAVVVTHDDLAGAPERIAQRLLDRWLLAFYEGPPLLEYVAPKPQRATRIR